MAKESKYNATERAAMKEIVAALFGQIESQITATIVKAVSADMVTVITTVKAAEKVSKAGRKIVSAHGLYDNVAGTFADSFPDLCGVPDGQSATLVASGHLRAGNEVAAAKLMPRMLAERVLKQIAKESGAFEVQGSPGGYDRYFLPGEAPEYKSKSDAAAILGGGFGMSLRLATSTPAVPLESVQRPLPAVGQGPSLPSQAQG